MSTLSRKVILITTAIDLCNSRLYSISSIKALKSICFTHIFFLYKDGYMKEVQAFCRSSTATSFYVIIKRKNKIGVIEREKQRGTEMKRKLLLQFANYANDNQMVSKYKSWVERKNRSSCLLIQR